MFFAMSPDKHSLSTLLCRLYPSPRTPDYPHIHETPSPSRRIDWLGYTLILIAVTIFLLASYFIGREWYANGLLYIIEMFAVVFVNIAAVAILAVYLSDRETQRATSDQETRE